MNIGPALGWVSAGLVTYGHAHCLWWGQKEKKKRASNGTLRKTQLDTEWETTLCHFSWITQLFNAVQQNSEQKLKSRLSQPNKVELPGPETMSHLTFVLLVLPSI